MSLTIALATADDVAGVVRLEREVAEAPHWGEAEYVGMVAGGSELRRCLLVARVDERLVGFAVGKVVAGVAELESVAVRAAARRDRVGRALCAAVIGWAWEQGTWRVELEVRASSAGARALYGGLGFEEVGRRRAYYREPVEDAVLMTLERATGLYAGL